jgi:hypothetical protein
MDKDTTGTGNGNSTASSSSNPFADAVREVVRDELTGVSICTLAVVKSVTETDQRVTVSLDNDPAYVDDDVPLLASLAGDGHGDIPAVTPGDKVLVVFTADDVTAMTQTPGTSPEAPREKRHTNAVALPFSPYHDSEQVPAHDPGERVIAHPNGTTIRMGPPGSDDLSLSHPSGMSISLDSDPDDSDIDNDSDQHRRESPPGASGGIHATHPSGVGLTVSEHGVAVTPGDAKGEPSGGYGAGGYDAGTYGGGGGGDHGVFTHRQQNNPWRVEMAGDADRGIDGHRHLVPQGDGTYAMTGPPLPMRKTFEWFCARYEELANRSAPSLQDARSYYRRYRDWLADQTNAILDPIVSGTNPDDDEGWPYPEPVPTAAERDEFAPTGYGDGGYGGGEYGN